MKKVVIFMLILALVLILTPSIIFAAGVGKGPVEKATGELMLDLPDNDYRHAEFNAHEAKEGGTAKGVFIWDQIKENGTVIHHEVAIDDVVITGNEAWFSGISSSTTNGEPGQWDGHRLYIHVIDDGTPGSNGDFFALHWDTQSQYYAYDIIEGNLVVHTYN